MFMLLLARKSNGFPEKTLIVNKGLIQCPLAEIGKENFGEHSFNGFAV